MLRFDKIPSSGNFLRNFFIKHLICTQYSSFRNMDLFATLEKNSYIIVNKKKVQVPNLKILR